MDNHRFGSAYMELPEKKTPSNPERREILEAPRKWMHFFDVMMQGYLGGENIPPRSEVIPILKEYYIWNHRFLAPLMDRARAIDNPATSNDIANEFVFHQLNGPLTFMWDQLLYDNVQRYDSTSLTHIQAHLAVTMTPSMQRLMKIPSNTTNMHESKEQKRLKGALSESDTAITLLELVKQNPQLVVVPAPEMFERSRHFSNRNADILLIDTENKQTRGIQVKTNTVEGMGGEHQYDNDYITVVDAAHELGNTTFTKANVQRRMSLPGQIAMGLLSERPLKDVPDAVRPSDFMRSRQVAKELMHGRKSFLTQAASQLSKRVISDLYKNQDNKADETTEIDKIA